MRTDIKALGKQKVRENDNDAYDERKADSESEGEDAELEKPKYLKESNSGIEQKEELDSDFGLRDELPTNDITLIIAPADTPDSWGTPSRDDTDANSVRGGDIMPDDSVDMTSDIVDVSDAILDNSKEMIDAVVGGEVLKHDWGALSDIPATPPGSSLLGDAFSFEKENSISSSFPLHLQVRKARMSHGGCAISDTEDYISDDNLEEAESPPPGFGERPFGGSVRLHEQRFDDEVKPRWIYTTTEGKIHKYPAEFEAMLETIYFSTSSYKKQPFIDHNNKNVLVDVWKMTHTFIESGIAYEVKRINTLTESKEVESVETPTLVTAVFEFPSIEPSQSEEEVEAIEVKSEIPSENLNHPTKREKQGWLQKKIGLQILHVFSKRWCVLTADGEFSWFKNTNRSNAERTIKCREIDEIEQQGNLFRIKQGKQIITFRHEKEEEIKGWVEMIRAGYTYE